MDQQSDVWVWSNNKITGITKQEAIKIMRLSKIEGWSIVSKRKKSTNSNHDSKAKFLDPSCENTHKKLFKQIFCAVILIVKMLSVKNTKSAWKV